MIDLKTWNTQTLKDFIEACQIDHLLPNEFISYETIDILSNLEISDLNLNRFIGKFVKDSKSHKIVVKKIKLLQNQSKKWMNSTKKGILLVLFLFLFNL